MIDWNIIVPVRYVMHKIVNQSIGPVSKTFVFIFVFQNLLTAAFALSKQSRQRVTRLTLFTLNVNVKKYLR